MMVPSIPKPIARWHELIAQKDPTGLGDLLADDVQFFSPVVFAPQVGKGITILYLTAAFEVLAGETFRYVRALYGEHDAVLEFETMVDEVMINGVDLIRWNDAGQIDSFKVMVRPHRAMQKLQQAMAAKLKGIGR